MTHIPDITDAMIEAGIRAEAQNYDTPTPELVVAIYTAMYSASQPADDVAKTMRDWHPSVRQHFTETLPKRLIEWAEGTDTRWFSMTAAEARICAEGLTALSQPSQDVEAMREALGKCRNKFREYEQLHRLKNTAEGTAKAKRNSEMADMCDAALTPKEPGQS